MPTSFKVEFKVTPAGDLELTVDPSTISKVVYSIESADYEYFTSETHTLVESSTEVSMEDIPPGEYNIVVAGVCQGKHYLTGQEPLVKSQFRIEANN